MKIPANWLNMFEDAKEWAQSSVNTVWERMKQSEFLQDRAETSADTLVIGPKTSAQGDMKAEDLIVKGTVDGRIRSAHLTVRTSGTLRGQVFASSLEVEEQAIVDAQCHVMEKKSEPKRWEQKRNEPEAW